MLPRIQCQKVADCKRAKKEKDNNADLKTEGWEEGAQLRNPLPPFGLVYSNCVYVAVGR